LLLHAARQRFEAVFVTRGSLLARKGGARVGRRRTLPARRHLRAGREDPDEIEVRLRAQRPGRLVGDVLRVVKRTFANGFGSQNLALIQAPARKLRVHRQRRKDEADACGLKPLKLVQSMRTAVAEVARVSEKRLRK